MRSRIAIFFISFFLISAIYKLCLGMDELLFLELCKRGHFAKVAETLSLYNLANAKNDYGITALMQAAYCQESTSKKIVTLLLKHGADPNAQDVLGRTALMWAMNNPHPIPIVEALASAKTNLSLQDNTGRTALMWATCKWKLHTDNLAIVDLLVKKGSNVNIRDKEGDTALTIACTFPSRKIASEMVEILCRAGAEVNLKNNSGKTPLNEALEMGYLQAAHRMLISGANPLLRNSSGQTPREIAKRLGYPKDFIEILRNSERPAADKFIQSCREGRVAEVKQMLDLGISAKTKYPLGFSALTAAASSHFEHVDEVIKLLLAHGADPNERLHNGLTPLLLASSYGWSEKVKPLLFYGANVHAKNANNKTPLLIAAKTTSDADLILDLLERGADPNYTPDESPTALMLVGQNTNLKSPVRAMEALLKKGASLNAVDFEGKTALMRSIENPRPLPMIEALIKAGADVHRKDNRGRTALHWAVAGTKYHSDPRVVSLLVKNGADVHTPDSDGNTPLLLACANHFKEDGKQIVEILLKANVNTKVRNSEWETPLIAAAKEGNVATIDLLLQHGADALAVDKKGKSAFAYALQSRNTAPCERLLKEESIAKNHTILSTLYDGKTPLMIAVEHKEGAPLVQALIKNGVDINAQDSDGKTALMRTTDEKVLQILIEAKADVNIADKTGNTALTHAIARNHVTAVKRLLDANANPNVSHDGRTPLIWLAATNGNPVIIKELIRHNADKNFRDSKGWTPLMWAAFRNRSQKNQKESALHILLAQGCDAAISVNGYTALMIAAQSNPDVDIIEALAKKSNVNAQDSEGKTALMYAAEHNSAAIVKALLSKGADKTLRDAHGRSALTYAVQASKSEIYSLLSDDTKLPR